MEKTEWTTQLRRGILEYSILLHMEKKQMYGYELISSLSKWNILATAEGTIYPLLRRLEKEHLITSNWEESVPGLPPRKYYRLTDEGTEFLNMMNIEWGNVTEAINHIRNEEETNGTVN